VFFAKLLNYKQTHFGTLFAILIPSIKFLLTGETTMGLFDRITNLFSASINDLLDKAEDPEKMANQMIRNMESSIQELEEGTASALASSKMTLSKLHKAEKERDQWTESATNALEQGNDELARKALMRKKSIEQNIAIYTTQAADANKLANHMKEEYQAVKEKMDEARSKRDLLITKKKAADSREKMNDTASKFDKHLSNANSAFGSVSNSSDMFNRLEEKIDKQMHEVEAREELREDNIEREFNELKKTSEIDDELAALKAKIKK
jgi:phage shock protein A